MSSEDTETFPDNNPRHNPHIAFKLSIACIGGGIMLILMVMILVHGNTSKTDLYDNKNKSRIKIPVRAKIMMLNTFSIFFLFMSIVEFNLYDAVNPLGIHFSNLSDDCKSPMRSGFWTIMVTIIGLMIYNFSIFRNMFSDPKIESDEKKRLDISSERIKGFDRHIKHGQDNIKDIGLVDIVREKPSFLSEKIVSILIAIVSITIYFCFILVVQYGQSTPLKACVGNSSAVVNIYTNPPTTLPNVPANCLLQNALDADKVCGNITCPTGKTPKCGSPTQGLDGCWACTACICT
jgi:hypothetical protein